MNQHDDNAHSPARIGTIAGRYFRTVNSELGS